MQLPCLKPFSGFRINRSSAWHQEPHELVLAGFSRLTSWAYTCVTLLGLPWQNTLGWGAKIRQVYFLTTPEARSLRTKQQQGWFLLRPCSLACSWLCLRMVFSLCIQISSSYEESCIGWRPTSMTLFWLNHLFKGLIPKYSHILRYWVFGF